MYSSGRVEGGLMAPENGHKTRFQVDSTTYFFQIWTVKDGIAQNKSFYKRRIAGMHKKEWKAE